MKTKIYILLLLVLTGGLVATDAKADDARLKQMLQTLTGRLRAAETERNNLLSDKAQLEQEKKTLTGKVDALNKQASADKAQIEALQVKEKDLDAANESIAKWKAAYGQLTAAAQKSEAERAKLASESIILKRKLEDRERKNLELYKTANEILTRYEKFGLGEALSAKEPFTGITRVKLENQVQDYQDKIADAKVKPENERVTPENERAKTQKK